MSGRVVLPPDQYVASLARKRMAAGALFRDEAGGVLLVDPVYKPVWDLPGGAVEAEESPHVACRREVREELGWTVRLGGCWQLTGCDHHDSSEAGGPVTSQGELYERDPDAWNAYLAEGNARQPRKR